MHSAEQPPAVPGLVLGDVLGRGADGPVWSAVDAAGEPRAVKVLPVPRHGGLGAEEARLEVAAACFEHEHIVRVHDVVACSVEGRPALALVMERLDGGSLGRVIAERGRLSAGEVVTVIAPVASALAVLHARGIVHGDVSPGNVLLAANASRRSRTSVSPGSSATPGSRWRRPTECSRPRSSSARCPRRRATCTPWAPSPGGA